MGEVDDKPFLKVFQSIYSDEAIQLEHAALLVSKWQEAIRDAQWHPFKRVGTGEEMKEVVDDEDEKLQNLKLEWGEDVLNAVKVALEELNKFNPSGRYECPVLWNFEYGRKATLKEGISHMMELIKHLKGT
ncbi:XH domain-containing protein [Raphanus sativus]|nr:XH domain-containing protein [Raphanus sativus]